MERDSNTAALLARLRSGEHSVDDQELAIRIVAWSGIPSRELQRTRDRALRAYRDGTCDGVRHVKKQARKVYTDLIRYAASAWKRSHRGSPNVPDEIRDKPQHQLWLAMKNGAINGRGETLSFGQLCRILK